MSPENVREKRRFTIVVIPGSESSAPRTFSMSLWGFILSLSAAFFGITVLLLAILNFTPARSLLPVPNSEMERKYGIRLVEIQDEVNRLMVELNKLRGYNLRLRKALGEQISTSDSLLIVANEKFLGERVAQQRNDDSSSYAAPATQSEAANQFSKMSAAFSSTNRDQRSLIEMPLTMPVRGYVTRGFDLRYQHYGIDFVTREGSAVLAAADGSVLFSGWTYNDGLMLLLAHDQGYVTVYKHNEALLKTTGDMVKRGEVIALLGNTGATSFGPHLHFEVWRDGIAYNPQDYLLMTQ